MKAVKASLGRALDRPDPAIRFYLFYGPDESGSRALALKLLRGLGDAEKFIVLSNDIKSDPAALARSGGNALFGGRRGCGSRPREKSRWRDRVLEVRASVRRGALAGPLRKTRRCSSCRANPARSRIVRGCPRVAMNAWERSCRTSAVDGSGSASAGTADNQSGGCAKELVICAFLGRPRSPARLDHATIDLIGPTQRK